MEWNDWNDWSEWNEWNDWNAVKGTKKKAPFFGDSSRPFHDGLRRSFFTSGRFFFTSGRDVGMWQHLAASGCDARSSSTAGLFVGAAKSPLGGFGVELPENPWWGPCEV